MSKVKQDKTNKNKRIKDTEFIVTNYSGLLDFLLITLNKKSRNNIKSLLLYRGISVNGRIITQFDYKLNPGDTVRLVPTLNREKNQINTIDIVFEDDDLIVINKPSGMLSIATDKEKEITAYHLLSEYVKKKNKKARIFVVHRLDRDTSGVLMVAKNEEMKFALQDNWSELMLERGYIAIVEGQLKEKSGRIRSWLKVTKSLIVYSSNEAGNGLEAITNYQVIDETEYYSLLKIQLETGRKNQIRVHMKDLGHPVAGDKKYGAKTNPIKQLGLHAYKLKFRHPFTDEVMCFETETPKEFNSIFKRINKPLGDN
ncbi:MAG: RluA family pseudouridine synthase [Bacillota bacterium]|nr:RluA family pseudouridine synthase [Bacillota bacterium]